MFILSISPALSKAPIRFADGLKEGQRLEKAYPISNALPALYGLATTSQEESLFPYIALRLRDIGEENRRRWATPYGAFYVLGALYQEEMAGEDEAFMRKHWSPMICRHNDTAWENFGDEGIGTLSHAWSASPTYFLTTEILGVQLGYPERLPLDRVVIAPQAEAVEWARGTVLDLEESPC